MDSKNLSIGEALHQGMHQAMKLDGKVVCYGLGVGKTSNIFGTTNNLIQKFVRDDIMNTTDYKPTWQGLI